MPLLKSSFVVSFVLSYPLLAQQINPTSTPAELEVVTPSISTSTTVADTLAKKAEDPMFQRVQELHKRQQVFLQNFSKGEIRPFASIVEQWPTYQKQLPELQTLYTSFNQSVSPTERGTLASKLLPLLQPVGKVLLSADHGTYQQNVLSNAKQAELKKLEEDFNEVPSATDTSNLILLTPEVFYTLKNLPVPLTFSAPKGTQIMLHSELGGLFSNRLPFISLTADENGSATTTWVSRGEAVADGLIIYRSPEFPGKGRIIPIVKKLELIPLEKFSPVIKQVSALDNAPAK